MDLDCIQNTLNIYFHLFNLSYLPPDYTQVPYPSETCTYADADALLRYEYRLLRKVSELNMQISKENGTCKHKTDGATSWVGVVGQLKNSKLYHNATLRIVKGGARYKLKDPIIQYQVLYSRLSRWVSEENPPGIILIKFQNGYIQ